MSPVPFRVGVVELAAFMMAVGTAFAIIVAIAAAVVIAARRPRPVAGSCQNWGSQLPEGARFCPRCGAAVSEASRSEAPAGGDQRPDSPQSAPSGPPSQAPATDDRGMSVLCHLAAFAGFFVPFGNILGPLLVWLLRRYDSSLVDFHGKEAVNFQVSVTLYLIIGGIILVPVALASAATGFPVGLAVFPLVTLLMIGLAVFAIIVTILAAVGANEGQPYRYPLSIRFIR